MKGDFTRSTFQPQKHYTGVRMQQGRLQLDADWNEQVDILADLNQIQLQDIIGVSGVPEKNGGFEIKTTDDSKGLTISAGNIYVNGILCKLEQQVNYDQQPDYPNTLQSSLENGDYLVYLDVWQRHITAIEDPEIRETALVNVPDTATRTKTIGQVKLILESQWEEFQKKYVARQVYLTPNVKSTSGLKSAIASDQGLENHLYRVEIHKAGNGNKPSFKWSRDNGSIVSAITDIKENTIIIQNFGRDDLQSFAAGQWIEITDEIRELQNRPGSLVRLTAATSGRQLTFDPDTVDGDAINKENFDVKNHQVKVRRWDNNSNTDQATIAIDVDEWISLEAGIEVKFEASALYQPGDYWQLPVRSEQRIEEIPWSGKLQVAQGIKHYYCELAKVTFNGTGFQTPEDKRPKFQPLTNRLTELNNKLDTTGGILTGSLGVGLVSKKTPQARLQIQGGEAKNINGGTIVSQNGSTEIIESEGLDVGELKAGDIIITAAGETTAIADTKDVEGTFTVKPPFSSAIPPGTTFTYQSPIALFTSNNGATSLIINAIGNVGIGTVAPAAKLEVVGKVKITDDSTIDQNLTVKGIITTANLNVTGTFQADTFTGNRLQISGDSNIGGSVAIANNLTVNDRITTTNLNVSGIFQADTFTGNRLQISGDSNIGGSLAITNDLNVSAKTTTANLEVTNTLQGNNLLISGDSNIAGSLAITNDLNVSAKTTTANLEVTNTLQGNNLLISGDSNIAGSLEITNNLNVSAKTTTANLEVTNTLQASNLQGNNLQINSNGNIAGSLAITNDLNVSAKTTTTNLEVTNTLQGNNLQINSNGNIAGSLAITNNLNVSAKTTTANLEVTNTLQASTLQGNNLQINSNGNIAGSLAITNNLNVSAKTTTANLEVTGTGQIANLQANNLQIAGNSTINGLLKINGNLQGTQGLAIREFSNDVTRNRDNAVPTEKAVKSYVDSRFGGTSFMREQPDDLQTRNLTVAANLTTIGKINLGTGQQPAKLYVQGSPAIIAPGNISASLDRREIELQGNDTHPELYVGDLITAGSETRLINTTNPLTIKNNFCREVNQVSFTYQEPAIRVAASDGQTELVITAQDKPAPDLPSKVVMGTLGKDTKLQIESDVDIIGNLTAFNLASNSSRELKENIVDLSPQEGTEILKNLNPVKFSYKNDLSKRLHFGFIAEDAPDVIASPDKTAIHTLDTVAILTQVVKEQQKTIGILSHFIKAHQTTIQALEGRIKKLETPNQ